MTADRATDDQAELQVEGSGDHGEVRRDVPRRRATRRTAATSAAAAMDDLDAAESEELTAGRSQADIDALFERYRKLPPVTAQALAAHIRGGGRIEDGKTHQMWDWTNADVCAVIRPVLQRRFDVLARHRELSQDMGFDDEGNRVAREGDRDRVVSRAGDRFNDIWREPSGRRRYGTERGLLLAEAQLLRTRYWRLETEEIDEGRRAEDKRRNAAQVTLFVFCLLLFVVLMVVVLSL